MGVRDLWAVLEPACEPCTLANLRGKRLAVDISGWIFQAKDFQPQFNFLSRMLFWRLFHLIRNQVRLIVVFDGPTPAIKQAAVNKRLGFTASGTMPDSNFRKWCEECKSILRSLCIPYIISNGDAEATCAYLNQCGEVDGCITEDNDALLFGASVVYTHFSCDEVKVEGMRCYQMDVIQERMNLSRKHLVSLALLLGCDYGLEGVKGIGKEHAMKLFKGWKDADPLQRMKEWRNNAELENLASFDVKKPEHCRRCRHIGSLDEHKTSGCTACCQDKETPGTEPSSSSTRTSSDCRPRSKLDVLCTCNWHTSMAVHVSRQVELKVCAAALKDKTFPSDKVVEAYMNPVKMATCKKFSWTRPLFSQVQSCVKSIFAKWDEEKVVGVTLQLLTAHDMLELVDQTNSVDASQYSRPDRVKSMGKKNGRQFYDILWKSIPGVPEMVSKSKELVTREYKEIFCASFPSVAAKYEDWLSDKEDTPRGKKRKPVDEVPLDQPSIKEFFQARKRLVFDSMPKDSPCRPVSPNSALIVSPECQ